MMAKRSYGSAFGGFSSRRVRARTVRRKRPSLRRRRPVRYARSSRRIAYTRRYVRRGWFRGAIVDQKPVGRRGVSKWTTSPGTDWHHYTWASTFESSVVAGAIYPVIELTSPTENFMQAGPILTHPNSLGTLGDPTGAVSKILDHNYWTGSYPGGEKILLKDTYTSVRIEVPSPDNLEFPVEVHFIVFRPKFKSSPIAHTDVAKWLWDDIDMMRVSNREKYEIRSIRTWRPRDAEEAKQNSLFHFRVPINRVCHTSTGLDAAAVSDWGYSGESGWYLAIIHNDRTNSDNQYLKFVVQQRITWIGQT